MLMKNSVKHFGILVTILSLVSCGQELTGLPNSTETAAPTAGAATIISPTAAMTSLMPTVDAALLQPDLTRANQISQRDIRAWQLPDSHIRQIAYSPMGMYLAIAGSEALIYRADTMELFAKLPGSKDLLTIAWSPDGKRLATGSSNGTVTVWDVASQKELSRFEIEALQVTDMKWSPDGQRLVAPCLPPATGGGTLKIWEAMTGKETATLDLGSDLYASVAWSPDGKLIAGGMSQHGFVTLWEATTGKQQTKIKEISAQTWGITWVNSIEWSPDGKLLADGLGSDTPGQSVVVIYDPATGQEQDIITIPMDPKQIQGVETDPGIYYAPWEIDSIAWSPDSKLLAIGAYNSTLQVWDISTGKAMASLDNIGTGKSISWSPDGKTLAVGAYEGTLILWDMGGFLK